MVKEEIVMNSINKYILLLTIFIVMIAITGCSNNTEVSVDYENKESTLTHFKKNVHKADISSEVHGMNPKFELEELLNSDLIVHGKVRRILPAVVTEYDPEEIDEEIIKTVNHAHTNIIIEVKDVISGDYEEKELAIRRMGGVAEHRGRQQVVAFETHIPHFAMHQEVVLFLNHEKLLQTPRGFNDDQYFEYKVFHKWIHDSEDGHTFTPEDHPSISLSIEELREKANKE